MIADYPQDRDAKSNRLIGLHPPLAMRRLRTRLARLCDG